MDLSGDVSSLPLPADATAPAMARRHSREVLVRWRLTALLEPVLLIVSELVTNAVRHGRPPVKLGLLRDRTHVRVEVHDGSRQHGAPGEPGFDAESGRGLMIVEALASSSGVEYVPNDGKVFWAEVEGEDACGAHG